MLLFHKTQVRTTHMNVYYKANGDNQRKRQQIRGFIKKKLEENKICLSDVNIECTLVWETIDELHHALNKIPKSEDPLEEFCKGEPDADECRVYDV